MEFIKSVGSGQVEHVVRPCRAVKGFSLSIASPVFFLFPLSKSSLFVSHCYAVVVRVLWFRLVDVQCLWL